MTITGSITTEGKITFVEKKSLPVNDPDKMAGKRPTPASFRSFRSFQIMFTDVQPTSAGLDLGSSELRASVLTTSPLIFNVCERMT